MANSASAIRKRQVLLVEDHAIMRRSVVRLLEPEADVFAVADGKSAVSRIASRSFDLVLVDYQLPDLSGAQLLRQLRAVDPRPRRVVISGAVVPEQAQLLHDGLAHDFLQKPVPLAVWLDLFDRSAAAQENSRG